MTTLPRESDLRKKIPITTGFLDYFPLAVAYAAMISYLGNEKHNPGEPLHWSRDKSADHADCIGRHMLDRDYDDNGVLEAGQAFWRAGAQLQLMLERAQASGVDIWAPIRVSDPAKTLRAEKMWAGESASGPVGAHTDDQSPGRYAYPASAVTGLTEEILSSGGRGQNRR